MATDSRVLRLLRRLAALLIRGPEAVFIRADLDDATERDLERGIPMWRAQWRYAVNVLGSALSARPARWRASRLGVSWLDVRIGLRLLVKQPGLTAVAVFALAVGIPVGLIPLHAASAFEAPPPFAEAEQLQVLKNINVATSRWEAPSAYDFVQWREELTAFSALAMTTRGASYNVIAEDGRAAPIRGAEVTASTFDIVRVRPLLGRTLIAADELAGAPRVVVISHDLWQSRLGADPEVLGRSIRIGGVPRTVVGVMPQGFLFPIRDHLWIPLRVTAATDDHERGRPRIVFGRLSDSVSPEEAQAELMAVGQRMAIASPETHGRLRNEVVPFTIGLFGAGKEGLRGEAGFYGFQVLALLVLAIACANVGMLILARTATRSGEIAVRTALGASRTRVVTQMFTESLVFAVLAAGVGLLIADQISSTLFGWLLDALPYWTNFRVTLATVGWALVLAVLSAGLVSVIPALKVTGKAVQLNIQRAASGRSGVRFGGISSALIIADVTIAVAALGVAVGLSDGLTDIQDSRGIQAEQFLFAELRLPQFESGSDAAAFDEGAFELRLREAQQSLLQRLAAEPGVQGVAVGSSLPGMDHPRSGVEVDGIEHSEDFGDIRVSRARVDADFFDAFGQPVLSGRGFDSTELAEDSPAVIVNTGFVDRILSGQNPIGRRVRYATAADEEPGPWYEIVGVVGPLGMDLVDPGRAGMYHPSAPGKLHPLRLAIHVGDDPESFAPRLRALTGEVDATAIVWDPKALDKIVSFDAKIVGWVTTGAMALVGMLLALSGSGTYALMSFTVAQRRREIGIRTALGAQRSNIVRTIAKRALVQLGVGVLLGMAIAGRVLFEFHRAGRIPSQSPLLLAIAMGVGVMLLIGTLACVVPTLRALKIMPTEALRSGA